MKDFSASNNRRYDLSNRLIHFFRDLDLTSDNAPATPQHWGHSSMPEDVDMPAFFLLRHCIRQGRIWATWSYRNTGRAIYGPRPAVCFTDMPIPAFVETSRARHAKGQLISSYALVLPKQAVFTLGGRPVIYGLAMKAGAISTTSGGERSLPGVVLPPQEQYRYVGYDPTSGKLDWTHEREWRWPLDGRPWHDPDGIPPGESSDLPGLEIDDPAVRGIGVITRTADEADRVVHDILTKVDRGDIDAAQYQFVLAAETIAEWSTVRDHDDVETLIYDNMVDLAVHFGGRRKHAGKLADEVDRIAREVEAETPKMKSDRYMQFGGCWLWLRNNRHPIVRAMARLGRVTVTREGLYLIDLPAIDQYRSLQQRQEMVDEVAARLRRLHGLPGTYYSVAGSWDVNAIPSFHNDTLSDDYFYNFSFDPS